MAVDRVRPHFFEIDVGSDFVLGVVLAAFASGLVTGVRANFAARVSQLEGGSYSACAWRMRCEIYLTTSSLATCSRQSVYDSEVLSINQLRLRAIFSLKRESISVAGARMSFGRASNGPDFDTDLSRNVNLLRLIGSFNQVSCLRHIVVVLCDICGWLELL
jgi:hypothetical protein